MDWGGHRGPPPSWRGFARRSVERGPGAQVCFDLGKRHFNEVESGSAVAVLSGRGRKTGAPIEMSSCPEGIAGQADAYV